MIQDLTTQYQKFLKKPRLDRHIRPKEFKNYQRQALDNNLTMIHIFELCWLYKMGQLRDKNNSWTYWTRTESPVWRPNTQQTMPGVLGLSPATDKQRQLVYQVVTGDYHSDPGICFLMPINTRLNRNLRCTEEDCINVMQTGIIPDWFFQTQQEYIRFREFSEEKLVDQLLLA